MKQEIGRKVLKDKVVVKYDDGSEIYIPIATEAPENIIVDLEPQSKDAGHTFTQEELEKGGYND